MPKSSTDKDAPKLIDTVELAAALGVSERHVFNLRRRGCPCYPVGRTIRFKLERVLEWIERHGARKTPGRKKASKASRTKSRA
jgi:phage terminase Nu1 subunit (DNA packaging protein)